MTTQYPCACGWARHSLHIEIDPDDPSHQVRVTVVTEPDGWRERIAAAWRMLTGHEHTTSEVYLTKEQGLALRSYLHVELDPPSTKAYHWMVINKPTDGG